MENLINLSIESDAKLSQLGGTVIFLQHVDTKDLRMAGVLFKNKLVDTINQEKTIITKVGECVQGYIWEVVRGQYGFKNYTMDKLRQEINGYVNDVRKRPNTREIMKWRDEHHKNVSIYALGATYELFESSPDHH